ncbi:MAG: phospholipase D-like domain-containing protein [Bacteriovoracaceae bacterium]
MKQKIVFVLVLFELFSFSANADSIEVFFNHNPQKSYTDPYYSRSRPGDNLEHLILKAIAEAEQSIEIAVYELDLPNVALALVEKKKQNVKIKIVLENTNARLWRTLSAEEIAKLNEHDQNKYREFFHFADVNGDGMVTDEERLSKSSLEILKNGGINWIDDSADGSQGSGLMHHKFMIVDGKVLITGSANFTRSCIHGDSLKPKSIGNANSLLRIESTDLISKFQTEFDELWIKHKFGLKKNFRGAKSTVVNGIKVMVQFSPTSKKMGWDASTNALIARQYSDASLSGDEALFVFSDQSIVNEMQKAHQRGMKNRTLIDPSFATRYYSELLDIFGLKMKNPQCLYEAANAPWANPNLDSGFTVLDQGDVLHHKFAVIDQRKVIVGSHNWSESANVQNDEALLVIDSPQIAQSFTAEFEHLYKRSIVGPPLWLTKKIADIEMNCQRARQLF